jgi:peroxin-5
MALPMLAGGAECGPSNPLQSLSKQFDKDRGVQQVCTTPLYQATGSQPLPCKHQMESNFPTYRTYSSLLTLAHLVRYVANDCIHDDHLTQKSIIQAFRTAHQASLDHDAARFFSSPGPSSGSPAFDLSALNMALPTSPIHATAPSPMVQAPRPAMNWAADFMIQQPAGASSSSSSSIVGNATSPTAMVQSPVSMHSPTTQQFHQQQQSISGKVYLPTHLAYIV